MGDTDGATIKNGMGQGSFAAALASSINIGTAVYDIRKGEVSDNIRNMPKTVSFLKTTSPKLTVQWRMPGKRRRTSGGCWRVNSSGQMCPSLW